jgi:hypothetical protein
MSERTSRLVGLVAAILAAIAYFVSQTLAEQRAGYVSPTVYGRGGGGLSVLDELYRSDPTASARHHRTSYLDAEDLDDDRAVALFAPLAAPTPRERKILADFVEQGGRLVVSFQNEAQLPVLTSLLAGVDVTFSARKNDGYANGRAETAVARRDGLLLRAGETYAFYSPFRIEGEECAPGAAECFVREYDYGDGKVVLFAGLPPVANGLVGQADNRRIALRFLDELSPIAFDEFHHFFASKTLTRLLGEPQFLLPVALLFLLALGYLVFAWTPFHEQALDQPTKAPAPPIEKLGEDFAVRLLGSASGYESALRLQVDTLRREFPREAAEGCRSVNFDVKTLADFLRESARLVALHRHCLRKTSRL